MKIAYIVPYVPNHIRTRPYNLINQLVSMGHKVSVFTLGSGKQDLRDLAALRSKVPDVHYQEQSVWYSLWNSLVAVPTSRPLQTVYSWNPILAKKLIGLLSVPGAFDIVHIEHLRGSYYGQYVKSKLPHFPVVWDSVDCISYLFRQASTQNAGGFGKFITRFELGRTMLMEAKLISEFDQILVTSETDRNALLELASSNSNPAPISVLSNGVDMEYFHPNPEIQRDEESLVFSGKMSYHANISTVKYLVAEIMPRIWIKRPDVRLTIVGKDPPMDVRALGADPRITVTGTVDDIRPYLWRATAAVVPLVYGAGIQNKVLEAMACGTPVVTTSRTVSSLGITHGKELMVADGADDFSQTVLNLLENTTEQYELGSEASNYVQNHHSWIEIGRQLLMYYSRAISLSYSD
jgi:glycosyltransferase involved in cell wall biosynthesis